VTNPGAPFLLDAEPGEAIPEVGSERLVLGRDPFESPGDAPPERLSHPRREDAVAGAAAPPSRPLEEVEGPLAEATLASPRRRVPRGRGPQAVPRISEVESPEGGGLLDRWIGDEARRRFAALRQLVEGAGGYDPFGFSPEVSRRAFPFFLALYRFWFRAISSGHEHLPASGPVVLAANHGGLLPLDGAMAVVDVFLHTDPPRVLRAIVDRWAGSLPWVNVFYARVGQVVGTRENFAELLRDEQMILVFPEGMDGVRKPITQRHRLQAFRVGFVEEALRGRAPIVPTAIIGSDDQAPILYDLKPLAKRLGLPMLPITPTFPWLGPIGLLPYPVKYRIVYGEPLRFHERFGPEGASDARLVRALANQVRRAVQQLIDRNRS
jgi:1-acyl-sn-glycerol-3-phosphate acyltransferase